MTTTLSVYAMIGALVASLLVSAVQLTRLLPQFAPQIAELRADLRVLFDTAFNLLGSAMNVGSGLVFVLQLVMLMSIDAAYFPTILAAVKQKWALAVEALGNSAKLNRSFMIMTAIFGTIVAALNLARLLILGVPGAGLWALLSFVCGFIAFIGDISESKAMLATQCAKARQGHN
ncbi:hypothetical protein [Arthrobacter alpinus]|uniref:hypothetical protein n=1 Tax=Arthrobacter alpinus TaxID=656366 RepID=UPI001645880C|nr:hypothetical protein [Arthrobacter alpinus]